MSESAAAVESSDSSFQTFDSFDDSEVATPDEAVDDWSQPEPEAKESKPKDEGLKVLDDTVVDGEGDVVKEEGKKAPKKAEKEETSEDEVEEEKPLEDQPINEANEDKKAKKLRMRMGEDLFNIDSNSTFKIKVDGEQVDVELQDLINNYSGKTAWDKKFTELGKEKKAVEFEKNTVVKQKEQLIQHLTQALDPIKDPNKNPLDSLLYLVELSGEDPYNAYRRIMEANLDTISELYDMDETQRELFFHKKKDELHSNVNKKRQDRVTQEQAFNQTVQKVDALRQAKNVTEDQFVDASEELEQIYKDSGLDAKTITDEAIVDYASLKPHIATVKELVEPYVDNISEQKYGDVVAELSRYLRDKKMDTKAIQEVLKRNFSVEEEVKELNSKLYQKSSKQGKKASVREDESNGNESFDDLDV
jgi:hypothetical protein